MRRVIVSTSPNPWRAVLLLWLSATLSACGFHLRGEVQLPPVMARPYIDAGRSPELASDLEDLLKGNGITPVDSRDAASSVIRLTGESRNRRLTTVSVSGTASGYELSYQAGFEVVAADGQVLLGQASLSRSQDISLTANNNILGKSREEEQIYTRLRRAVAGAILQRIQYSLPGTPP